MKSKGFKKVMQGALLCGALAAISVTADAQVIYETSFSSGEGYVNGPLLGQPAGGSGAWIDSFEADPLTNYVVENGQLVLTQKGSGSEWARVHFPVQVDGVMTITWDWQYVGPADGTVDHGLCISDSLNFNLDGNPDATFGEQGAMVRMQPAGIIDVRNGDWAGGGTYAALNNFQFQDGAKISMRMEIDVFALTLNVYGTREGESEVVLAENYGFRRIPTVENNGVDCLIMWLNGTVADTQVIVDNIKIFGPASVMEWSLQ